MFGNILLKKINISRLNNDNFYLLSYFIILFELLTIIYTPALFGDFVFDDMDLVVNNERIQSIKNAPEIITRFITGIYGRPMREFTYMIDYHISQLEPYSYHVQNLFWYFLTLILFFSLMRGFSSNKIFPYLATTIFAMHPVHTEVVSYISGRRDLLCMFFLIIIFYYSLEMLKSESFKVKIEIIIYFTYILSLASKETALMFPLIFFLYDYFITGTLRNIIKSRGRFYLIIGIISFSFLIIMSISPDIDIISDTNAVLWGKNYFYHLMTVLKIHVQYLKLLFYPKTLILDYSNYIPYTKNIMELNILFSFILVVGLLITGVFLYSKRNIFGYLILFHFIALFPVSHIFLYHELMAERYLYLPTISFSIFISILLIKCIKFPNRYIKITGVLIFAVMIILFTLRTFSRNLDWSNSLNLFESDVKLNPNSARQRINLANELLKMRELDRVEGIINEFYQKYQVDERKYLLAGSPYATLGTLYFLKFDYQKSLHYFMKEFERKKENDKDIYIQIADCYFKMKEYDKAITFYKKKLDVDIKDYTTRKKYANSYIMKGDYNLALEELSFLKKVIPNDIEVLSNLASVYGTLGIYKEAIKHYKMVYILNPAYKKLLVNMAIVYYKNGDLNRARFLFNKVQRENPNDRQAAEGLRVIEELTKSE